MPLSVSWMARQDSRTEWNGSEAAALTPRDQQVVCNRCTRRSEAILNARLTPRNPDQD